MSTPADTEQRLRELGLSLPPVPKPGGNYVPAVRSGNLLFLSGQTPDGDQPGGKVDSEVNADAGFSGSPKVINGCSDLLIEVLGERGRHARSAVGLAALPGNVCVEIEAVVEADDR